METRPPKSKPPRRPLTYRKLFHWGIGFWLVVWLASACFREIAMVVLKDSNSFCAEMGEGAVSLYYDGLDPSASGTLRFQHVETWSTSQLKLIREYPEILIGKLARFGWRQRSGRHLLSLPIAGILWLWLAAGFYGEMKLLRHPAAIPDGARASIMGSRNRVLMLGGALLALCGIVVVAECLSRRAEDADSCAGQIRVIQEYLGRVPVGERIRWDLVRGKHWCGNRIQLECTHGEPYQLSPVKPPVGMPEAQCPREDHRRYFAGNYGEK